jgi:hypothetical protein
MPDLNLSLLEPLSAKISPSQADALARQAGFLRRSSGKITPSGFLRAACLFALQSAGSLASFAQSWATLHHQTLSRQAVHKRCSTAAVAFLQAVLQSALPSLLPVPDGPKPGFFRRVLLQDSTCLSLPKKLARFFPGPSNQTGQPQACLKIQAVLDLARNQWVRFHLAPFTCNDQAASPQIVEDLQPGDLIIRDLGYLVLGVLRQIHQAGAYFLSRWRYGLLVLLPDSGQKADLLQLFGQSQLWEGAVVLGREKLPVRLVAQRLPERLAAERRRKALQNRDRRLRPSPEYLALLGWNIFITNAPREALAADILIRLYALRWRIEIIFKAWKSHFHLENLRPGSAVQAMLIVLGKLIWITWFSVQFSGLLASGAKASVLKTAQWFSRFALLLFQATPPSPECLRQLLLYYCRYDKRRKRLNFLQQCAALG